MTDTAGPLTLEGLAQILRNHMDETAARFAELAQIVLRQMEQLEEHRRELAEHRREVADQGRQIEEHRQYIRQVFARMEQHDARMAEHDARFEAMTRDIRRILDAMERRGGDGGSRAEE
ncbi:MAG TPA: hypothetical protein VLT62_30435 [Candidatus Methylomirabilis sp.]|nr:hypothetical protein [Candidatus Methylomirabilis sp.]